MTQEELDYPITREEVFRAIRRLKLGNAPGVDRIRTDILKHAAAAVYTNRLRQDNTVIDALTLFFNYVLETEVWPARWKEGVIFPLHKDDSRLDPGNYRPITLLSVIGKLFGQILNSRLQQWTEDNGKVADEQGGFRHTRPDFLTARNPNVQERRRERHVRDLH